MNGCDHNDLLDRMLDGEPMMIVMSPELRRRLRRRARERAIEDLDDLRRTGRRM